MIRQLNRLKGYKHKLTKQQYRFKHPENRRPNREVTFDANIWRKDNNLAIQPEDIPQNKGTLFTPEISHRDRSDGFNIISIEDKSNVATLTLFVKAGSRYENPTTSGSSHFLKRLAFQSSEKKYFLPLIRDVDVRGSELGSFNTKEYVGYYIRGMKTSINNMISTLGAMFEPRLEEWEVNSVRKQVSEDSILASQDPYNVLFENLHYEAFRDSPLANPLTCPKHQIDAIDNLSLRDYVNTHYQLDRMILVGTGFNANVLSYFSQEHFIKTDYEASIHNVVGKTIDDHFPVLRKPGTINDKKSQYVGGSVVRISGSGNTQIAIAYEGVGESDQTASLTAAILKTILGGGYSLQRGIQPGTGRTSKLGQLVSNNDWLIQTNSFNFTYPETGLFGVYAEAERGNVPSLVEQLVSSLNSLTKVTDQEVEVAKNQLKFNFLDEMNDKLSLTEFLVTQFDVNGTAILPTEYIDKIDSITTESVRKLAQKILSSKPVVSIIGDIEGFQRI